MRTSDVGWGLPVQLMCVLPSWTYGEGSVAAGGGQDELSPVATAVFVVAAGCLDLAAPTALCCGGRVRVN